LKLKYDEPLSNFASNFNLRRYSAAADNGHAKSCLILGQDMYKDLPYARQVGRA